MNRSTKVLQVVTPAQTRQQELQRRLASLSAKVRPAHSEPSPLSLETKDDAS